MSNDKNKNAIVISSVIAVAVIASGILLYSKLKNKETPQEELGILAEFPPTISQTLAPSPTVEPTVLANTIPAGTVTEESDTNMNSFYSEDLDLSLNYPKDWTLSNENKNVIDKAYSFLCNDPIGLTDLIKNTDSCVDGKIPAKIISLKSPQGSYITFWNATGRGGVGVCNEDSINIFGKEVLTCRGNKQSISYRNVFGTQVIPGEKSVWKDYILSLNYLPEEKDVMQGILDSIEIMN